MKKHSSNPVVLDKIDSEYEVKEQINTRSSKESAQKFIDQIRKLIKK